MEILKNKFYCTEAYFIIEYENAKYSLLFEFSLEDTYQHGFNPGSYYGHYETYSGKMPEDVKLVDVRKFVDGMEQEENVLKDVVEIFQRDYCSIMTELEEYVLEKYDYSKFA
jgi:hypothetical protein